jgi:hypothetical protein
MILWLLAPFISLSISNSLSIYISYKILDDSPRKQRLQFHMTNM